MVLWYFLPLQYSATPFIRVETLSEICNYFYLQVTMDNLAMVVTLVQKSLL